MFKLRHAPPSLWQRWFINGEVPCFTGPHLPLALLAMAVLLLCFLLIPLTTIISLDILKVHTHSVHSHLSGCFLEQGTEKCFINCRRSKCSLPSAEAAMVETLCSSTDCSLQGGGEMVEWCGAWKEVLVPAVLHPLPKKCGKEHSESMLVNPCLHRKCS